MLLGVLGWLFRLFMACLCHFVVIMVGLFILVLLVCLSYVVVFMVLLLLFVVCALRLRR